MQFKHASESSNASHGGLLAWSNRVHVSVAVSTSHPLNTTETVAPTDNWVDMKDLKFGLACWGISPRIPLKPEEGIHRSHTQDKIPGSLLNVSPEDIMVSTAYGEGTLANKSWVRHTSASGAHRKLSGLAIGIKKFNITSIKETWSENRPGEMRLTDYVP